MTITSSILLAVLLCVIVIDVIAFKTYVRFLKNVLGRQAGWVQDDWTLLSSGITDADLEKAWLRAAQHMYETFVKKNHDYGSENLATGGTKGLALRIGDKVSRLWQLTGLRNGDNRALVKDEGVADTFLDLGNYGIAGYLLSRDEWPSRATIDQTVGGRAIANLVIGSLHDLDDATVDEVWAAFMTARAEKELAL